jgi:hypothetical protein
MIPVLSGSSPAGVRVLVATHPVEFSPGAHRPGATVQ